MSLKAFHVFFIAVCVLFLAGFGYWGIADWMRTGSQMNFALAVGSGAGSLALLVYSRWFLRKTKHVSYL